VAFRYFQDDAPSGKIQIAILWMAILYIGTDFLSAGSGGFHPSTECCTGRRCARVCAVGVAMFKLNWGRL